MTLTPARASAADLAAATPGIRDRCVDFRRVASSANRRTAGEAMRRFGAGSA